MTRSYQRQANPDESFGDVRVPPDHHARQHNRHRVSVGWWRVVQCDGIRREEEPVKDGVKDGEKKISLKLFGLASLPISPAPNLAPTLLPRIVLSTVRSTDSPSQTNSPEPQCCTVLPSDTSRASCLLKTYRPLP